MLGEYFNEEEKERVVIKNYLVNKPGVIHTINFTLDHFKQIF